MTAPERWISKETEQKERDFRGLLHIHIPACKSILSRYPRASPYLFIDFHGGPGNLSYNGRRFSGSPLIALDELAAAQLPCETLHFEHDLAVAADLMQAVGSRSIRGMATVRPQPFEAGIAQWLADHGRQPYRLGLAYSDPIEEPIPVEAFNLLAEHLPRVDLLAYVAANNQYKRANANGYGHGRRLADDIAAVRKRYVLIREAHRAEQYTFILWSNWDQLPEWKKRGFYRLDTPKGQDTVEILDCTQKELHARRNTPLPFPPTGPTPNTSAIPASSPSAPSSSSVPEDCANAAVSDRQPSPTTSLTRPGGPSTSLRTSSPSAIPATAAPTGRSGDGES